MLSIHVLESVCNPCTPAEAGGREVPEAWQAAVWLVLWEDLGLS